MEKEYLSCTHKGTNLKSETTFNAQMVAQLPQITIHWVKFTAIELFHDLIGQILSLSGWIQMGIDRGPNPPSACLY